MILLTPKTSGEALADLIKICIIARRETKSEHEKIFYNSILSQLYEKKYKTEKRKCSLKPGKI